MDLALVARFQMVGADLSQHGLVSAHGGNLSARAGDDVIITRHGCSLARIKEDDLVTTGVEPGRPADAKASMELAVHRVIYTLTGAGAIVHAHPAHAIALSFTAVEIIPEDTEGAILLGRVPVVGLGQRLGPGEGGEEVARALQGRPVAMVRGHGCFAAGKDLEEAFSRVMTFEASCRILYLLKMMNGFGR